MWPNLPKYQMITFFFLRIFMVLNYHDYFYNQFSLIISTYATSSSRVHNVTFWDKYIKNWNMSDHYQQKQIWWKINVTYFSGLKFTYVSNKLLVLSSPACPYWCRSILEFLYNLYQVYAKKNWWSILVTSTTSPIFNQLTSVLLHSLLHLSI